MKFLSTLYWLKFIKLKLGAKLESYVQSYQNWKPRQSLEVVLNWGSLTASFDWLYLCHMVFYQLKAIFYSTDKINENQLENDRKFVWKMQQKLKLCLEIFKFSVLLLFWDFCSSVQLKNKSLNLTFVLEFEFSMLVTFRWKAEIDSSFFLIGTGHEIYHSKKLTTL